MAEIHEAIEEEDLDAVSELLANDPSCMEATEGISNPSSLIHALLGTYHDGRTTQQVAARPSSDRPRS